MCSPASMIVTKNKQVFWSKNTESHEEIIKEFGLNEGVGATVQEANFVRIEIKPPEDDMRKPLKDWIYILDEINPPSWYDKKEIETLCRKKLKCWFKAKVVTGNIEALTTGQYFIIGNATVNSVSGNATVNSVYGNATVNSVYGNATVTYVYGNATVNSVYGNATVNSVSGNATVNAVFDNAVIKTVRDNAVVNSVYGNATVNSVYGNATVNSVYGNATCIAYIMLGRNILKDEAVLIDRSGDVVKCYVGKKLKGKVP